MKPAALAICTLLAALAAWSHYPAVARAQYSQPTPSEEFVGEKPTPQYPEPRGQTIRLVDLAVLGGGLVLATLVILKFRRRWAVFVVMLGMLGYLGFYKNGCVCPIGAIQNVALSLVDPTYTISIVITLIFLLPIIFSLFAGRVFCGGVCPLGAVQDVMCRLPIHLPLWIDKPLRFPRWFYLAAALYWAVGGFGESLLVNVLMGGSIVGLIAYLMVRAVLRALKLWPKTTKFRAVAAVAGLLIVAAGTLGVYARLRAAWGPTLSFPRRFLICDYDPFVNIFRSVSVSAAIAGDWGRVFEITGVSSMWWLWVVTGGLLLVGVFVGRPYCRWLCPYGAILGVCARGAKKGVTVMPDECSDCGLCDKACPYGAIEDHAAINAFCVACARCYKACPHERQRLGLDVPQTVSLPAEPETLLAPPPVRTPVTWPRVEAVHDEVDIGYVDELVAHYGRDDAAALPILQAIQARHRYLPAPALRRVCELTDLTLARLTGLSTFYNQFRLAPIGEHLVRVCHGTACHVAGAQRVTDAIRRDLKLEPDADTDAGRQFTVQKIACMGCCSLAPVMTIDGVTFGHLTPETAQTVVRHVREGKVSLDVDQHGHDLGLPGGSCACDPLTGMPTPPKQESAS